MVSCDLQRDADPVAEDLEVEFSVVMPCLNEARTVGRCIDKAFSSLKRLGVRGEVIVADNGSTDGSVRIASEHGAQVIPVARKGYGAALQGGIEASRGRYIVMGDADDSYDFSVLDAFVERLRRGDDLVMGNRFRGGIKPGAMPWHHRYIGNPVLTGILNIFFRTPIGDAHCGLRGFSREAYRKLKLVTPGMEFASEMVVKAALHEQQMSEVPVVLHPDGRGRPPHLNSWRDGWRHLRFLLLMCPLWLYLIPAIILCTAGLGLMVWLTPGPRRIGSVGLDIHSLLLGCLCFVIGYQTLWMWAFARAYSLAFGLVRSDQDPIGWFRYLPLERGLIVGAAALGIGLCVNAWLFGWWWDLHLGALQIQVTMRYALWGSTLMIIGVQTIYNSFFLAMMQMQRAAAA
jgi:glycosyltransferase involved in cell wall biosynthesis